MAFLIYQTENSVKNILFQSYHTVSMIQRLHHVRFDIVILVGDVSM